MNRMPPAMVESLVKAVEVRGNSKIVVDSMTIEAIEEVEAAEVAEVEETGATEAAEVAVVEVVIGKIEVTAPKEISSLEMNTSNQETLQRTQISIYGTKMIRSSTAECSKQSSQARGVMTLK